MKILLMNIYYYPHLAGGAEISVMKLAKEFAKSEDNEVSVLCLQEDGLQPEEIINNVHVYRIRLTGDDKLTILKRVNRVFNISDYYKLSTFLRKLNPDVLHTNNLRLFSVGLWKAAYELGIPVVHTLRDYVLIDMFHYKFEQLIIKKYSNCVAAVTAPSKCTLDKHLEKDLFKKSVIKRSIVNSIDFDIDFGQQLYEIKSKNRKNKSNWEFAYIGRFSEEKGIDWLICVFNECGGGALLHLYGNGQLKSETRETISESTHIYDHGSVDEKTLNDELATIDVVIVPSLWEEPFGRVILDAYKNGCPVIVTDKGGMPENVINGQTGFIIKTTDNELKNAIVNIQNTQLLDFMSKNIQKVLPQYTVQCQAKNFMDVYTRIQE